MGIARKRRAAAKLAGVDPGPKYVSQTMLMQADLKQDAEGVFKAMQEAGRVPKEATFAEFCYFAWCKGMDLIVQGEQGAVEQRKQEPAEKALIEIQRDSERRLSDEERKKEIEDAIRTPGDCPELWHTLPNALGVRCGACGGRFKNATAAVIGQAREAGAGVPTP